MRNYPWYRGWHESFADAGLTVVGIHTPETAHEQDVDNVRQKAAESQFRFPIVVDNDKQIWNTWGNSWWPSVYLIDKRGYVRYWWYGELNFEGTDGDKILRKHIEELLAEKL